MRPKGAVWGRVGMTGHCACGWRWDSQRSDFIHISRSHWRVSSRGVMYHHGWPILEYVKKFPTCKNEIMEILFVNTRPPPLTDSLTLLLYSISVISGYYQSVANLAWSWHDGGVEVWMLVMQRETTSSLSLWSACLASRLSTCSEDGPRLSGWRR